MCTYCFVFFYCFLCWGSKTVVLHAVILLKVILFQHSLNIFPFTLDKQANQLLQVKVSLHQITFYIIPLFKYCFYVHNTSFLSLIYLAFKSLLDISQIITQFSQICVWLLSYYRANRLRQSFYGNATFFYIKLIAVDGWHQSFASRNPMFLRD